MSPKRLILIILLVLAVLLALVNGYLLKDNMAYKKTNRRLILQNDSLTSVLIECNNNNTNYPKPDSLSLSNGR